MVPVWAALQALVARAADDSSATAAVDTVFPLTCLLCTEPTNADTVDPATPLTVTCVRGHALSRCSMTLAVADDFAPACRCCGARVHSHIAAAAGMHALFPFVSCVDCCVVCGGRLC